MVKQNKTKRNHLSGRLDKDMGTITWGEDAEGKMIFHSFQTLVGGRGSNEG